MRYEITTILDNTRAYTKNELWYKLSEVKDEYFTFDIFMMQDYIKIDFSRVAKNQDEAIIHTLDDLENTGLRTLLRTLEMERM